MRILFVPFFIPLLLTGCTFSANAQKNVDTQQLLWVRYFLRVPLNEHWQYRQEIEERTYWFPWRQHQILIRGHVQRKLSNNWRAAPGFTYFLQSLPHDPAAPVSPCLVRLFNVPNEQCRAFVSLPGAQPDLFRLVNIFLTTRQSPE